MKYQKGEEKSADMLGNMFAFADKIQGLQAIKKLQIVWGYYEIASNLVSDVAIYLFGIFISDAISIMIEHKGKTFSFIQF